MATNTTLTNLKGRSRDVVLQASAAVAAADINRFDLINIPDNVRGVVVVINVTASAATPSVVFKVQGMGADGSVAYDILTSAAVTGAGQTVLRVHPEIDAAANVAAKDSVPSRVRIQATHADADSITYSVTASFTY